MRVVTDGKTVCAVVAFAPPTVEDAEVEATMRASFHAAGAGGFERTAWVVQPHVAAGNHLSGNVHVVVLNENQVTFEVAVLAQMDDVLDVSLAVVVARMGFAG